MRVHSRSLGDAGRTAAAWDAAIASTATFGTGHEPEEGQAHRAVLLQSQLYTVCQSEAARQPGGLLAVGCGIMLLPCTAVQTPRADCVRRRVLKTLAWSLRK